MMSRVLPTDSTSLSFIINGQQPAQQDYAVLRDHMGGIGTRDGEGTVQEVELLRRPIGLNEGGGHAFRAVQDILGQHGFSLPQPGDQTEPTSFPHWCQDLGVRWCITDANAPAGTDGFLRSLAEIPPENFLPANFARFVRLCETARLNQDTVTQEGCRILAPLGREPTSVVVIPRDTVAQARLPPSGARVVADCRGRHLQVRGDLPQARNLRLLRWAFADLYVIARSDFLPPAVLSDAGQTHVSMCPVGAARAGDGAQPRPRFWRTLVTHGIWSLGFRADGGYARTVGTPVPQAYVTQTCFAPGVADGRLPPRPSGVAGLFSIEAEIQRLEEGYDALAEESEHCWDGCQEDFCTRCEAIGERQESISSRLESLYDEIRDRIIATPEILRDLVPEHAAREGEYFRLCEENEVLDSLPEAEYERRNDHCMDLINRANMPEEAMLALSEHATTLAGEYYSTLDCENPAVENPRCTELDGELGFLESVLTDFRCSSLDAPENCYFDAQEALARRNAFELRHQLMGLSQLFAPMTR